MLCWQYWQGSSWYKSESGYIWGVEFDSNTVHVDKDIKLSPKKKLRIKKYLGTCGRGQRRQERRKFVYLTTQNGRFARISVPMLMYFTAVCVQSTTQKWTDLQLCGRRKLLATNFQFLSSYRQINNIIWLWSVISSRFFFNATYMQ